MLNNTKLDLDLNLIRSFKISPFYTLCSLTNNQVSVTDQIRWKTYNKLRNDL
jgi:hypothetical protein